MYFAQYKYFITSILKSLVILALLLALSNAIYSRISFALNHIFFLSRWEWDSKPKQPKAFFKLTNHIAGKWKTKKAIVWEIVERQKKPVCDFKSNSRCALFRFWNQAYDFRPNCTPLSSITIINYLIISYDVVFKVTPLKKELHMFVTIFVSRLCKLAVFNVPIILQVSFNILMYV